MQNVQIRVGLSGGLFFDLGWILVVGLASLWAGSILCKPFSFSFVFLLFYKNRDIAKLAKIIEKS